MRLSVTRRKEAWIDENIWWFRSMYRLVLIISTCLALETLCGSFVAAGTATPENEALQPLHVEIDRIVEAERVGPPTSICSDSEFLRRVYLDLAGKIPTAQEARDFLQDTRPDKRALLIDVLLQEPHFDRNFMRVFDVMLMERRIEKVISPGKFREFLRTSIEDRKPLDSLVREIIVADGAKDQQRPAARFLLDRAAEPHVLTRDVGRLFLGMDMQCAQCHDHPSIDDYLQSDYYGIYAFLNRTYLFGTEKEEVVAERAEGEAAFVSVFEGGDPQAMMPHLPGGKQLPEPEMEKEQRYVVQPAEGIRPIPKFSRRELLALELTSGKYTAFQKNLANRLWAHMFGRGIVHPLDLHHSENPPTNPALLATLGEGLLASKFDLRDFVRQIALSKTYQRSSELPEGLLDYARQSENDRKQTESVLQKQQEITGDLRTRVNTSNKTLVALEKEIHLLGETKQNVQQELTALQSNIDAQKMQFAQYKSVLPELDRAESKLKKLKQQAEELVQLEHKDPQLRQLSEQTAKQHRLIVAEREDAKKKSMAVQEQLQLQLRTKSTVESKLVEANAQVALLQNRRQKLVDQLLHLKAENQQQQIRFLALKAKVGDFECLQTLAVAAEDQDTDDSAYQEAWQQLAKRWRNRFQCGNVMPLSAEQLTWSISEALGIVDQKREALHQQSQEQQQKKQAAQEKTAASEQQKQLVKALHVQVEAALYDFIVNVHDHHGQPDGNYQATTKEALFLSHSKKLQDWIEQAAQKWAEETSTAANTEHLAEKIYLTILSRKPDIEEAAVVRGYLAARAEEPKTALRDLIWALLSCTEFRFQS